MAAAQPLRAADEAACFAVVGSGSRSWADFVAASASGGKAFQDERGLQTSGLPDQATLLELFGE